MKSKSQKQGEQMGAADSGIKMKTVCRSLLKIVARLEETQYTEGNQRQTDVSSHIDPAAPASDRTTPQG